jgi:hypothetical protein
MAPKRQTAGLMPSFEELQAMAGAKKKAKTAQSPGKAAEPAASQAEPAASQAKGSNSQADKPPSYDDITDAQPPEDFDIPSTQPANDESEDSEPDKAVGPKAAAKKAAAKRKIKVEKPDPNEQRQMLAKLHYLKKTGKSEPFDEYRSLPTEGKRAWFHQIYKADPTLSKYNTMSTCRNAFRTSQSEDLSEWFTEKQIMSFNGYHDDKSPDYESVKTALLTGLPVRHHDKPEMAALGIRQYKYKRVRTNESSGSTVCDSVVEQGEISDKAHEKLVKAFDTTDFTVPVPPSVPRERVAIQIEPWKRKAMDFEKTVQSQEGKASRLVQTAQSVILKLVKHHTSTGQTLSMATKENLEARLVHMKKALEDFTVQMSGVDTKTKDQAEKFEEVGLEALTVLKKHATAFEKVLNLSKGMLNTLD